jgi:hypothetical protein
MSLAPLNIQVFRDAAKKLDQFGCSSRRVISFGYPDILASPAALEFLLGKEGMGKLRYRPDSASIRAWHGIKSGYDIADAKSLFEVMGFELEVMDLVEARGGEIIQDLNFPVPDSLHGRYAAVIDGGTLEHCFNIGQAARNAAAMCAVGGFVLHGNPLNMYNHGFYNLSPVWYHDFYKANAFDIEAALLVHGPLDAPSAANSPLERRFVGLPDNTVQIVVARRREMRELAWPTQGKYVMNPTLRG